MAVILIAFGLAGILVIALFELMNSIERWADAGRIRKLLRYEQEYTPRADALASENGDSGMAISGTDHHRDPGAFRSNQVPPTVTESAYGNGGDVEFTNMYTHRTKSDAGDVLQSAHEILSDRNGQYGDPENTFALVADLWNDYLAFDAGVMRAITPTDVAMMMALLKIARIRRTPTRDSYIDLIGYAALAAQVSNGQTHETD
jgi:uncharacterized protein DUF6378